MHHNLVNKLNATKKHVVLSKGGAELLIEKRLRFDSRMICHSTYKEEQSFDWPTSHGYIIFYESTACGVHFMSLFRVADAQWNEG